MESAEHIISDLIRQGMIVSDIESAELLITYKINYSMLKRKKIFL